jgi:deaminated glutathione amidase
MVTMKVAVVQHPAGFDKPANLAAVQALVTEAAGEGATLVVAPEAAMHDFGPQDLALAQFAEPLDGPFVTGLADTASRLGITVVAGMFEAVAGDVTRAFNTVVAIGSTGELIGRYRKQHLFDALGWVESDRLVAGESQDRLVFDCDDMTVGVMTCYDIRFPELARALIDDGATLLAIPSAWVAGPGKADQFRTLARARAIENVAYVAAAVQGPPTYTGQSAIIDPLGEVLAELGEADGAAVADVTGERIVVCRGRMPSLQHRRWQVTPR